ncbi:hypothetical protein [Arthrobacter bambusae]|uniref:hypothetical protein n=1 Tax=Arthrobacter bambusae TaxID=1338426 RepID=UPI0027824C75|nr:hypothetical protein [Arthrobacter bambusae]MDQ0031462.1 hypothetical protein [Arthrobacter bambusae]MDQ0099650.1 hypothetical protein [Arthrobacter bambusae]
MTRSGSFLQAILTLVLGAFLLSGSSDPTTNAATPSRPLGRNLRGGWNLETPELVASAASAGVTVAFLYGAAPQPSSSLGTALSNRHMRVVSGEVSDLVSAYECTRTHTVAPKPSGAPPGDYCGPDPGYTLPNLLTDVRALVQRDRNNPLVAGYWVLDDTPDWDFGSLRTVLSDIRALIPTEYPAICGFSANLEPNGDDFWEPGLAENFTPEGCNMVAPYVYADSRTRTESAPSAIDWSMQQLLPKMEASLTQHGWDPSRQPLLGVGQAWAGQKADKGAVTYPPGTAQMVIQAKAYCAARAQGVAWYAWTISSLSNVESPYNNDSLREGVRESVGVCPNEGW